MKEALPLLCAEIKMCKIIKFAISGIWSDNNSDGVKDTSLEAKDSTLKAQTKEFKIALVDRQDEDSNTASNSWVT